MLATDATATRTVMGRQRASPETVQRHRDARAAKKAADKSRREKEAAVALRMFRRFYHNDKPINLILLDYRYWQFRRCGWDVMRVEWNEGSEPNDCRNWRWWLWIGWKWRDEFVKDSRWYRAGAKR